MRESSSSTGSAGLTPSLSIDLLANFLGTAWGALLQIALVPLYIRYLGIEGFGLIGFYAVLQGSMQILDLGLSPTMNREMARYSARASSSSDARDLARTVEVGYWAIGVVVGACLVFSARPIATAWVSTGVLAVEDVERAIPAMGMLLACQWPLTLYNGGLMGLQRQAQLNALKIAFATLNAVGSVVILLFWAPTIQAFFTWQVIVVGAQVAVTAVTFWHYLAVPAPSRTPRLRVSLLRQVWRFAAGVTGISLMALLLAQLDRLLLSRLLPLEEFGYYSLAVMIGSSLLVVISPIFNSLYPRFSVHAARGDIVALSDIYHFGAQLIAALLLPVSAVLALFSREALLLWTGIPAAVEHASFLVTLIVAGTAFNGLLYVPHALRLAYGWTRLGLWINATVFVVLVPGMTLAAIHYGAVGAATAGLCMNVLSVLLNVPLTHRRLLVGEGKQWLGSAFALPLLGTLVVVLPARLLLDETASRLEAAVRLLTVLPLAVACAALAAPRIRGLFQHRPTWTRPGSGQRIDAA